MPLIDWKENLILTWSANCVITSMEKQDARDVQGDNPEVYDDPQQFNTYYKRHKAICSSWHLFKTR